MSAKRARAHLERAEILGAKADAAGPGPVAKGHVLRKLLHTAAAAEELLIAAGKTRAEVRATRPPLPTRPRSRKT